MGKRELLLIAGIVVIGAIAYVLTAPPGPPGEEGFSFSRLIRQIRAEINEETVTVERTLTAAHEVGAGVRNVRVREHRGPVTIVGEDRDDVAADAHVRVTSVDKADAEGRAELFTFEVRQAGDALEVVLTPPAPRRGAAARANFRTGLTVRVPRRLAVQSTSSEGAVEVSGVASAQITATRAEARIRNVAGEVRSEQRDGEVVISGAGAARVVSRRGDVRVEKIAGAVVIDATDADVAVRGIGGETRIEAQRADVDVADVAAIHANTRDGRLRIQDIAQPVTIDAQRTPVTLVMRTATPLDVSVADDPLELTPPTGGFDLDAVALDGEIRINASQPAVTTVDREQRAQGAVGGGGPAFVLRATRGNITIR